MQVLSLGHVHLKVRELERSIEFYEWVTGYAVSERLGNYAFLSDGKSHHVVALQALGESAESPSRRAVGLYHVAFEVSSDEEYKKLVERIGERVRVTSVDHGISWASYFEDPDGNGVEIYVDRRHSRDGSPNWASHLARNH